ncbi:FecR family protein [Chitinophaga costaii]|uniref:FecR family protein n=1 Tax=Chitinophaga costaii TaxID=1335309 RepID=A0A1C4ELZ1_9BACT|nr:FecR family protein [Chitinophaga costaii]PUZ22435.1 DUF4974 domain-containing protein [Chitinophaga costaii]SCC44581.1 FecR family protein [Chitinophaga costaii]
MQDQDIILLIIKYKSGNLSPDEEAALFSWYHQAAISDVQRLLHAAGEPAGREMPLTFRNQLESSLDAADTSIKAVPAVSGKLRRLHIGWWIAASLLIMAGVTYLLRRQPTASPAAVIAHVDVAPGRSGALLTLANGVVVNLDSAGNTAIVAQQGAQLDTLKGQLNYAGHQPAATDVAYNTITVPAARQFKVVLADGTSVWLNAGSALRYPTAFNGPERSVTISGEAYFEVAPRAQQPFQVKVSDGSTISVLGTQFNVNAYTDEQAVRTTLVSGSLRVSASGKDLLLQPGQQAVAANGVQLVKAANIAQAVAWKEGIFDFDKMDVAAVMRQLARWYDLQIIYENGVPDTRFYGEIGRNLQLSDVLEGLRLSGLHCRLEAGRRLIVLP